MPEENTDVSTSQNAQNEPQNAQSDTTTNDIKDTRTDAQKDTGDSQNKQSQTSIEELIQKAVDRATNKLGNENKKLRGQLDTLKKDKLTDDEIKKLEIADREADIADREAKLQERENRLFAIKAIKDAGLDDGSSNALDLVDFVMTDDEETTTARVKAFESLVRKFVSAEVNRTFKDNGRNPEKGGSANANSQNDIASNIGKAMAQQTAVTNEVLKYYLGGK